MGYCECYLCFPLLRSIIFLECSTVMKSILKQLIHTGKHSLVSRSYISEICGCVF
jgi:hypothetical protein